MRPAFPVTFWQSARAAFRSNDAFQPTSASHCFVYEHPRLGRSQRLFEACASLSFRGLLPWKGRPGDRAFHDAPSASAGDPGSRLAFSAMHSRTNRASDTPVASSEHAITLVSAWPKTPPRPHLQVLREEQPTQVA
jgi:hypothetical protein